MRTTASDPFGEQWPAPLRTTLNVLGAVFTVESSSAAALQLAVDAFGGLPRHRLGAEPRHFRVRLVSTRHPRTWRGREPPRPTLAAGSGLLCATVDAANFAVIDAAQARAIVCMSPAMLRHPYHARYELIELAMVTLASRGQSLVPLHAACIGASGSGVLLMGSSGAGKSTLALHALAAGMQFLSEDSAFVCDAGTLHVTGAPNYLHVAPSALKFLKTGPLLAEIQRSPMIRRRSGARKYELDVRAVQGRIAAAPLRVSSIVFLSRRAAGRSGALRALNRKSLLGRLRREQPYAAGLANWRRFERRAATLPAYELRRTTHPDAAIQQLRALITKIRKRS